MEEGKQNILEDSKKIVLDLSNIKLCMIPTKLYSFEKLLRLDLSKNFLKEITILPKNLIKLDISNNELSYLSIPDECSNLRSLDVSENNISVVNKIPSSIEVLDLSFNKLSELQPIFSSFVNLIKLNIDKNDDITELNNIPSSLKFIDASCSLNTIDNLEDTNIIEFNGCFNNINVITKLPKNIKKLVLMSSNINDFMPGSIIPDTLEELCLSDNIINNLCPYFIFSNIKKLDLSSCGLKFIPRLNFDVLESLDISDNNFFAKYPVINKNILKLLDYRGPQFTENDQDIYNDNFQKLINHKNMGLKRKLMIERMNKRRKIETLKDPDYIVLNENEIVV